MGGSGTGEGGQWGFAMRARLVVCTVAASVMVLGLFEGSASADSQSPSKETTPAVADPANEFISALVGTNGRFSEGAFPGSASQYKIMFGWPGTGTSYTTVNVDGVPSVFGDSPGSITSGPTDTSASSNATTWVNSGVSTTQSLSLVTNPDTGRADTVAISYRMTNIDVATHDVGLRFMNDVDVNDNDGAPFRLPGLGAVTSEVDLVGAAIPDTFQVYASLSDSSHLAAARLRGAAATSPDRLVVGTWPGLVGSSWAYTTTPGRPITSDSAYAVYWNPVTLAAGASRTVTTYYGLSDVTVDLAPPLALGVSGPTQLAVSGGAYTPNPFTVTATVSDSGTGEATGVTLTLQLPPGLHTASPNPVALGTLAPGGQEGQASWQVVADPRSDPLTLSTYSVTASASNSASKTVSRTVSIPALISCSDILFIGARGSGQSGDGVSDRTSPNYDGGTGLGPQIYSVYTSFAAKILPDATIDRVALDYRARAVPLIAGKVPSPRLSDWQDFMRSVDEGVTALRSELTSRAGTCGRQKIVLSGYSQGAMSIHRAIRQLDALGYSGITDRISAVVFIADGDRVPRDNTVRYGSAGELFGGVAWSFGTASSVKFSRTWGQRVHSVCNARDVVCDFTGSGANLTGLGTHTKYTATLPLMDAARAAAAQTRRALGI